jgi:hypothetical protein
MQLLAERGPEVLELDGTAEPAAAQTAIGFGFTVSAHAFSICADPTSA